MKQALLIVSLLFTALTNAQVPKGLSAAAGINSTYFESEESTGPGRGYHVGLAYNWGSNTKFNYEANIFYTKSALRPHYTIVGDHGIGKIDFNSVDAVLLFNYYPLNPGPGKFMQVSKGEVLPAFPLIGT